MIAQFRAALAEEKAKRLEVEAKVEALQKQVEELAAKKGASEADEESRKAAQKQGDTQALQAHYFQTIGELERAVREHKGLEPTAPLPPDDVQKVREQALASVRSRKEDMAVLRQLGL